MRKLRYLLGFVVALVVSGYGFADTVFYQPRPSDASLSESQWQQVWRQARSQGYDTVVIQWSHHGETDYLGWPEADERGKHTPGERWFREVLELAVAEELQLVVGLYTENGMSEILAGDDPVYYLHHLLSQSREQMKKAVAWNLPVSEWFIPLSLEDRHLRQPVLLEEVAKQINSLKRLTALPVSLDVISSGLYTPGRFAEWLQVLTAAGLRLWWRPSPDASLPSLVEDTYLQQMGCGVGIIVSDDAEGIRQDELFDACHRQAFASLRALPNMQALASGQP